MKLLEAVNLTEAAHRKASAYSKGMRQRLVFARSLINNPKMLFLDEPTSGLDPNTAAIIKEIILQKKKDGCTIFLTTHSMATADDLCDTVAFLNDGKMVAMDSPRNLKLAYGERSVRVEYGDNGSVLEQVFFLDKADDHRLFTDLVQAQRIQTIHTQEATLEQIFMRLTGRGLA
jgi:fluoroquinolone transport system ATP-binding protein